MNYSGLTLGEFLENEEFQNYEVLCGRKGLSRIVNSATVMDAVDIENWLNCYDIGVYLERQPQNVFEND